MIGKRILERQITETLDPKEFEGIPVANINDVMGRLFQMNGIVSMNKRKMVGRAVTAKVGYGDNLYVYRAIETIKPGDVLVVSTNEDYNRAVVGGIIALYLETKGAAGMVIDGAVRDIDELEESEMGVFAASVNSNGPYKFGPGEVNVPIAVGGQVVCAGDYIIGDEDGVIVIPQGHAAEVLKLAKEKFQQEEDLIKQLEETKTMDVSWVYEKTE